MSIKIKKIILFFFLTSFGLQAQIQKISDLSNNQFLDSKIIYDNNGEDVWGYFLLYKGDKKSKSIQEYQFVILDKNLNKVGSNKFQQEFSNHWFTEAFPNIDYLNKNENELIFGIDFDNRYDFGSFLFRKIDLKTFEISSAYFSRNEQLIQDNGLIQNFDEKKLLPDFFVPVANKGFIKYEREYKGKNEFSSLSEFRKADFKGYSFYDLNLKKKWEVKYKLTEDSGENCYSEFANDKYFVVRKNFYGKVYKGKNKYFYEVKDISTGQDIISIPIEDFKYTYVNNKVFIQDNKIYIFDRIYEFDKKNEIYQKKCLGISKRVYDIDKKTFLEQKFMFWTDLAKFHKISKYGEIKGIFIHLLDFKITLEGKTMIVGEGYFTGQQSTIIKNLYTFGLDSEFKVESFGEIETQKTTYSDYVAYGDKLEANNLFDFMYSQKIRSDEFVYFYSDNEVKRGFLDSVLPELSELLPDNWVLGIVVYSDGEFKHQKIKLKTNKGKIYPMKAKKGFIILQEVSKTDNEIRLEKIDY